MAKEPAPSQNELIAAHIQKGRDEGVDFSVASARRASIHSFCEANPKANPASVAAAHKVQLAKLAKKWGQNPGAFVAAPRGKKKFNKSMNAHISERPADVKDPGPDGSGGFRAGGASQGPPGGAGPGGARPGEPRAARPERYSAKTAGHIVNTAYNVVAGGRAEARPLPPDTVDSLGEVWTGPLNYYLYDHPHAELAIAVLATLGVFARYAGVSFRKKKKKKMPDGEPEAEDVPDEERARAEPDEEKAREEHLAKQRAKFGAAAQGEGGEY